MSRRDGIEVWIDGEKELYLNMQRRMDGSIKAAMQGLHLAGAQIIVDAKQNLRDGDNVVTGQLRASGKVQRVEGDNSQIDVGFFGKDTRGGYAAYVEYGRRSGKMPPVDEIAQWLRKKSAVRAGGKSALASAAAFMGRKPADYIRSLAWAIARTIGKKGTRPHPFFGPAVEKNKKAISDAIAEAVRKETEKNG